MKTRYIEQIIRGLRVRPTPGKDQERLENILTAHDRWWQAHVTCNRPRRLAYRWAAGMTIASIVIVMMYLTAPPELPDQASFDEGQTKVVSPDRIITAGSLQTAFCQGGLEGIERQLDQALEVYGPWPVDLAEQDYF